MITNEMILEAIDQKTVLELSELIEKVKEKFNVRIPDVITPVEKTEKVEEKTEFDVVRIDVGKERIKVIKVIRAISGIALQDIKDYIAELPRALVEQLPKSEAEKFKKQLEEVGAKIELK